MEVKQELQQGFVSLGPCGPISNSWLRDEVVSLGEPLRGT